MLFNVAVVSREEYDAHMEELRAEGNTGRLDDSYSRLQANDSDSAEGSDN